jgi:hypothetical protein
VLPGEYRLVASSPVAGNPARAVKKITLEDSDLNDLVIAMPKPALPVDAFVQGSSQLYKLGFDKIHVVLQPAVGENEEDADISGANATREVSTDGHGFFRNLTPSRPAKVEFATVVGSSSEFVDWYVDSVYRNREDVTFTGFDPTSTGTLNILFSPNGGELNGKVSNDKGVAFPGATVLLYPEEQHMSRPDLYHAAKTDQNGEFSIHGIAPGTYRLLAWDWVEPGALYDPEFLKNFDNDAQTTRIEKGGEYDVTLILTPDAEEASGR